MRSRSRESEAAAIVLARTLPVRERRSPRPELLASEKKNLAQTGQGLFSARNLGRSRSGNRTLRGWREMRRPKPNEKVCRPRGGAAMMKRTKGRWRAGTHFESFSGPLSMFRAKRALNM